MDIYVLKLENGKYYVGKSKSVDKRIKQHFSGKGCYWTQKYKPIKVKEIIKDCDEFDEDKYVKKYMKQYGIDNVRGGSYSRFELEKNELQVLKKEIDTSDDCCYKCGSSEHFVNDCTKKDWWKIVKTLAYDFFENITIENVCYRCGRPSHYANNCYATYDVDGNRL